MNNQTTINYLDSNNPKMLKFLGEMNQLLTRYQYQLVPVILYSKKAIVPSIDLVDIIPTTPEKKEIKKRKRGKK